MKRKLRAHFIPNSHLDREWTMDFQKHRRLLTLFLDRLLEIFDRINDYTFLLDSQTIPLEDYIEMRPEKRGELVRRIKEGRLSVGPWYTAPDAQTITGESVVRNLLLGHKTGEAFGGVMKVGYTPFGFCQISQLPQIYAGFGIDFIFFYRGITDHESPAAEFEWAGPDGTVATCSRFGKRSRYNFFMEVWRPVIFGGGMYDRIHDWRRNGVPFKRADAAHEHDHYFLRAPRLNINIEKIRPAWDTLMKLERPHYLTHVIPLMQGMDTTMPDEREAEIVERIRELLEPGEEIFFSTLEAYVADLKQALKGKKLRRFEGEMRHGGRASPYATILENVVSARVRQKIHQTRAAWSLERVAEPLATLLHTLGEPWPGSWLDLAWKHLLQCHPHDTVAGCGVDQIERDSHYRLDQVERLCDVVTDEALGALVARVNTTRLKEDEIAITLFNPSPYPRAEVVEALIDTPHNLNMPDFTIETPDGKAVRWDFSYRKQGEKTVRNNTDLTMALPCWTVAVHILAGEIPALGYQTLVMKRRDVMPASRERIARSARILDNGILRITVNPDGTLDMIETASACTWRGLHYFEDQGEKGQGWESRQPDRDTVVSSIGCPVEISLVENTALSATIRVRYQMNIPTGIIHDDTWHDARRGERAAPLIIETHFTLRAGARRLDCRTRFTNQALHHRLRVFFPTHLKAARESCAESAFDVVRRPIERDVNGSLGQRAGVQHPCLRFVDVSDGMSGFAVLTEGLHEYEVSEDKSRTLGLTLLRAFEATFCTVSYRWERRPDQPLSQQPGVHECRYAILPHDGDWEVGGVMREAERFILPLIPCQSAPLKREEAAGPLLPISCALCEIQPEGLVLSALKRAEDGNGIIVRVYNPTGKRIAGRIGFHKKPAKAILTDMKEDPLPESALKLSRGAVSVAVLSKKIVTLRVLF
ncbi:MAG TPA: glycoside hydrolase family 38 C-terminal domain-containing protein [Candidatus Sumerlaeota bacterium]|nr:glycoside hydrolase family 38 C-terminal domain-containing protein [Candidatus Sumerlaeota bacterium]